MSTYTFDLDEPWSRWQEQLESLARELEGKARLREAERVVQETSLPWPALWIGYPADPGTPLR